MTLTKIVEMLKSAPSTQIDAHVMTKIKAVDVTNETAVRELMEYVYKSGFYGNVTPFVAQLCNPEFTNKYPLA